MPGCWEILSSNRVLVGILHTETTTLAWSFGLRNLIVPGDDRLRTFSPFLPVAGMPFDHARNVICKAALEVGASHVFMLDSDVIPPRDAIVRLLAHNKDFISGTYFRRSPPEGVPVAQKNGTWLDLKQHPPNRLIEVDLVGAGCLLLSRKMLESLPPQRPEAGKHWFDWRVDAAGTGLYPPGKCLSEDFTLNVHAREHGFITYLDPTIKCLHAGYSQASEGSLKPLHVNPLT